MVAPALEQLRALKKNNATGVCRVVEATVVSKPRLLQALPERLVRDIDIHRDPRGHCAYNEKLGRLKLEYIKIALQRAEALHQERLGRSLLDTDLMLVTRPDVDLYGGGASVVKGLEEMAAMILRCASWVTLRACWVTLRARWVTLRVRWVTLRARWVTL
jgi:hypothetical protein